MEIIPKQCLSFLPFTAEPISKWSDRTDLSKFLLNLFDQDAIVTAESGEQFKTNYASYGKHLRLNGQRRFRRLSRQFMKIANEQKPAPAGLGKQEVVPNFYRDVIQFGLVAKYFIAWGGIVSAVLSESAFMSIAHVLESEEELNCSLLLASHLYYKQALQVLRSFIEFMILQLHFCEDESAFAAWKDDNFRVPPLRGRKGLIERLRVNAILPKSLGDTAADLYGGLNASIHGSESRLVHRGAFAGNWAGRIFKLKPFEEWCEYFAKCVDMAIPLMRIHINEWERIRLAPGSGLRCDVCHNRTNFQIEREVFANEEHAVINCKKCGSSITMALSALAARTQNTE